MARTCHRHMPMLCATTIGRHHMPTPNATATCQRQMSRPNAPAKCHRQNATATCQHHIPSPFATTRRHRQTPTNRHMPPPAVIAKRHRHMPTAIRQGYMSMPYHRQTAPSYATAIHQSQTQKPNGIAKCPCYMLPPPATSVCHCHASPVPGICQNHTPPLYANAKVTQKHTCTPYREPWGGLSLPR